jgi:hypothetical protein
VDAQVGRVPEEVAEEADAAGDEREVDQQVVDEEGRLGRLAERDGDVVEAEEDQPDGGHRRGQDDAREAGPEALGGRNASMTIDETLPPRTSPLIARLSAIGQVPTWSRA